MIAHMLSNKKLNLRLTELFIRGRKLNISPAFIKQSYFSVSINIRSNSRHYLIMKIPNKEELQETAFYYSSNIDFKDYKSFKKLHCETIFFLRY